MTFFPSVDIAVCGERFTVTYSIVGPAESAYEAVSEICLEQSVELPDALVPTGGLRDQILGRIENFQPDGDRFRAGVSYPLELTDYNLPQLLNVIFGNTSMKSGIQVVDLALPERLLAAYPGPRFGSAGIRTLVHEPRRGLLGTALKPLGFSARQIADYAYQFALGGIHIIKDDHNLANQPFAPFRERVECCVEAVERANRQTGAHTIYIPNITAPLGEVEERAHFAVAAGAGGLEIAPGLCGWEALRCLAADPALNVPLFCHPALLGTYWINPQSGISLGVLLGQVARLAGEDAVIYTNYGGRFPTTVADARSLKEKCARAWGAFPSILPMPGGGMTIQRVPEMLEFYGDELILLISGGIYSLGPDLVENCRRFRSMIDHPNA